MAQGRLLILDDELTVGQMLVMAAQASGFEARLCTESAPFHDAIGTWAPTHLVVDLTLPETTGELVLRRLAEAGCRARVIVCSGADRREIDAALQLARELGLATAGALPKPFRLAALRELLGQAP